MITSIKIMQILIASSAAVFVIFPESKKAPGISLEGSGLVSVGSQKETSYGLDLALKGALMPKILGLRPALSFTGLSTGTYLVGIGIDKTVTLKDIDITLSFYPSYSSIGEKDKDKISGSLNFKTALDLSYSVNPRVKFGLGVAHISNGGLKKPNGGINLIKLTVGFNF
jgi:hypothetical protein